MLMFETFWMFEDGCGRVEEAAEVLVSQVEKDISKN